MTFIATALFSIDIVKLSNIVINETNSAKIYILFIIFLIIIFLIFITMLIYIIIDVKRFNFTNKLLLIHLRLKEESLKKNNLYIILCKLLHIFRAQSVIYYHTRMYMFFVKYEVIKWYIYKYSFISFVKEVFSIKFDKIDIFLLSYYYRWLVFNDSSDMREELRLIRLKENNIKIFLIKKIKGIKPTEKLSEKQINIEEILNILKSKEYKDLLKKNKYYINLQNIKKKCNKQLKINGSLMKNIEKNIYYFKFSNFYFKLSSIFFHYSLILFWLLTTTKVWFTDLKIKLVEPFIKIHSKYLIFQGVDNVTLRRKIVYQNNSTRDLQGHSKVITDEELDKYEFGRKLKYQYHFKTDEYSETDWYINRDNQVWAHYSGTGLFDKREHGLQTYHSYISRTDWGSELTFDLIKLEFPQLKKILENYNYIGYPEGLLDYAISIGYYIENAIIFKYHIIVIDYYDVDSSTTTPLVINFSLVFLLVLFQIWSVITFILISRKVQIIVKEYHFYFTMTFLFSIFFYLVTFIPYFDHNFIIDSWIYIIKLPFTYLKFNINDLQFIYILIC